MQDRINYNRIADAIDFIKKNFKQQPSLQQMAEAVHISPYHFQRMFTAWAGVSPKKFMQYISINYAKGLLQQENLFDVAYHTGLSGSSRLHDLFINIEGMTPGEYKKGGQNLNINYSFAESPFGKILVASTNKGICHMAFTETKESGFQTLKNRFPNASFQELVDAVQQDALFIFQYDWTKLNEIKLHLHATPFQLKVWEALLKIPFGNLSTYGSIAAEIGNPKATRAVGTAIGNNPVAYLIPCHRVIQSTGKSGGYMWGSVRKSAIIGWEASKVHEKKEL